MFQGGNSTAARRNGGYYADWYFSNGKDFDGVTEQVVEVRDHARDAGRDVRFGLNGFIIARDTEAEARDTLREIVEKANRPAVEGFRAAVQQAGNSTADKRGMWADSSFDDLVQYNDGFRTQLIGTPEQIAERIAAYRKRGVDLILGGFLHFQEEIEYFGSRVLAAGSRNRECGGELGRRSRACLRLTRGCASVVSNRSSGPSSRFSERRSDAASRGAAPQQTQERS